MGDWCQKAGMEMAIEVLANNMRNRVLGTWMGQAHGAEAGQHLELVIIATTPGCQGRGAGTALLRFLGDVADADGVPTHLETAGARNAGFYAAKGGYHEVHRSAVATFDHEGGGVAMQRPPGARPAVSARDGSPALAPLDRPAPTPAPLAAGPGPAAESPPAGGGVGARVCPGFRPKRATGPLASYCIDCGEHEAKCTAGLGLMRV